MRQTKITARHCTFGTLYICSLPRLGLHPLCAPLPTSPPPRGAAGLPAADITPHSSIQAAPYPSLAMAAPPPAAAAAAPEPLVALEVSHIPPGTTHSELAGIFSQFCAVEEVVTVFKHGSSLDGGSGDSGGSALVLLPPAAAARDSAEMAAEILHDYPLEGSLLGVQLCDSPAEWLRGALHPQVRAVGMG